MVLFVRFQILAPPPHSLAVRKALLCRLHSAWHTCHRPVNLPIHHQQHTWHHPRGYVLLSTMPPCLHLPPVTAARPPFPLRVSLSSAPRSPIPPPDLRLAILPRAALRSFSSSPPRPALAEGHAAEGRQSRNVGNPRAGADGGALAVSGGAESTGAKAGKQGERGKEEVGRGEARGDAPIVAEAAALRQGGDAGADVGAEAEVGRSQGGGAGGGKGGARRRGKRVRLDELCVARWAQYSRSQVRSWILQGGGWNPIPQSHPTVPSHSPIPQSHPTVPSHSPIPQSHPTVPSHSPIPQSHPSVPSLSPIPQSHPSVPSLSPIPQSHSLTTALSLAPVSLPRLYPTTLPSPAFPLPPFSPPRAGKVLVEGHPVTKAGAQVSEHADVIIKARVPKYVCRSAAHPLPPPLLPSLRSFSCQPHHTTPPASYLHALQRSTLIVQPAPCESSAASTLAGYKLEGALQQFSMAVGGAVALDAGLSTGGFADCLLQHGAARVYGVDVGYGQVSERIRVDPRVVVMERTNLRHLSPSDLPEQVDVVTLDLSFISVLLVMPAVVGVMKPGAHLIVLVKPQFEARRGQVGGGGIVRSEAVRQEVLERVTRGIEEYGMELQGVMTSPITGTDGNVEFLAHFVRRPLAAPQEVLPPGDSQDLP
ncbi:unnamed protein product [Closterium sp. NIES-53]